MSPSVLEGLPGKLDIKNTHLVFSMYVDQLCNILCNTTMMFLFTSHSKVIVAKITQSAVDKTQNL